ncbi:MAG TPA: adenylate/guanylate cyclase domain-containing protein [Nitrospirota bacterium]|nr:adenylate/guanylate cyclase domain-containing protein [Nitrospirota bacterium]
MPKKIIITLLIAVVIFIVTVSCYSFGLFEKPEYYFYDLQAKLLRSNKMSDSKIKVILIDEAALKSMEEIIGRWPWPRAIWSDLLDFLSIGGARNVLFDLLFLERDRYSETNDQTLIEATRTSQNVYHGMMIMREDPDKDARNNTDLNRPMAADFVNRFALKQVSGSLSVRPGTEYNNFSLPIPGLADASKGMTVVEFTPDSDGVYRRTKPLREYHGKYFTVLGLAPFVDAASTVEINADSITINGRIIPIDKNGNCIINMYGLDNVETYSMSGVFASLQKIRKGDVEDLLVNPDVFKDSIVFIGASAVGTADLKAIPVAPNAPGVMLHVFLANNYLQNDFMRPPDKRLTLFSVLLGVLLTSWAVMFSKRFIIQAAFPTFLLLLYTGYALLSFRSNAQVELMPFLFALVTTSFLSFGYLTFTEAVEKRHVSQLFTQYVSKDVLNEVLNNYKEYTKSSAGQKVELTVLFSDIRGFTTMSENAPPEKIVEMLNIHFSVMADIILKHNGTIDKYIGDAIMAFWGAPVKRDDHAERSVLAAQEMLEGLKEVNKTLRERGFDLEVKIGIGINTGVATIGEIGSEKKKNYTIVGDTVNLASRLESITKEYKTPLIFSEYTYEKIKNRINGKLLGNVKVKGREQPVDIYTVA